MVVLPDDILLFTKMNPPAPREAMLAREPLMRQMNEAMRGRLTAVCAPAGFGKSTLIARWARTSGMRAAWLSLDGTDNDLTRFWRYVLRTLIAAAPTRLAERLAQAIPLLSGGASVLPAVDAMLNELAASGEPLALVLDDYHALRLPSIHDSVAYMINYLPPHVHMAIASRSDLPFPVSKWQARGEYRAIGVRQLQLTAAETRDFCRGVAGVPLQPEQIGKLLAKTEGWIAGLQLAALSLRARDDRDRYIDSFGGSHREVSDYLFHEVTDGLPADIREFLLQTCVLDELDAATCDAVAGRSDSREMLHRLRSLHLFLLPLDETGRWFRYHHLFSDFLRSLLRGADPAGWRSGHLAASRALAARGMLDKAVDHAAAGEDYGRAAELLERCAPAALQRGEFATLLRQFEAIAPHAALHTDLSLLHAFALMATGRTDRAEEELERLERTLAQLADPQARERLQGGMLFLRSNLLFYSGRYERWYAFAGQMAGTLPENPLFYNFNYNASEALVRRTVFGLQGALSADTERIALLFTEVLEQRGWQQSLISLYVAQSLSEGYYEWDRLDECVELAYRIRRSGRFAQMPGLFVPNLITQARAHAARGELALAHGMIDEGMRMAGACGEHHWLPQLRAFRIRLHLQEGRTAAAKREAALLQPAGQERPPAGRLFEYTAMARCLSAQGRPAEALRLLEAIKQAAAREACLMSLAEIAVLQALYELQRGQRAAALRSAREALAIGERNGYIRSFIDEGPAMAKLLRMYVREREDAAAANAARRVRSADAARPGADGTREDADGTAAYAARLLQLMPRERKARPAESALVEPLNDRETAILGRIKQGASNREIAAAMAFTEGTVKVYLSRIYAKLGVSSRTQAVAAAESLGLIE